MNRLSQIEESLKKKNVPAAKVGDTVKVFVKIREGEKERVQVFEGTVIARKGGGNREMLTVRKISFGVGVEKIFPLHSPTLEKIQVLREGRVRRSKLYYLRDRKGKAARVKEGKPVFAGRSARKPMVVKEKAEEAEPVQAEKS